MSVTLANVSIRMTETFAGAVRAAQAHGRPARLRACCAAEGLSVLEYLERYGIVEVFGAVGLPMESRRGRLDDLAAALSEFDASPQDCRDEFIDDWREAEACAAEPDVLAKERAGAAWDRILIIADQLGLERPRPGDPEPLAPLRQAVEASRQGSREPPAAGPASPSPSGAIPHE